MYHKIVHKTDYTYKDSVTICHNIVRLTPRNTNAQHCRQSVIVIEPEPDVMIRYDDFFGNKLIYFSIEKEHEKLSVHVISEIEKLTPQYTGYVNDNLVTWEEVCAQMVIFNPENLDKKQFIASTPMTEADDAIEAFARLSFAPGRQLMEACKNLMTRIFTEFKFQSGFTTISTPLSVVMKERKGVCQDFAHLAIACIRAMKLPARYVSGYIETLAPPGKEKLAGVDASHAWFAVYIPGSGWVDFDPTNNMLPADRHITIGWGRDYADITPLRGVILTSGKHELEISVDVRRAF